MLGTPVYSWYYHGRFFLHPNGVICIYSHQFLLLFHVFKLAPTSSTILESYPQRPTVSGPLTLNVRDVVVLHAVAHPLPQGIAEDFLWQAVCKLEDHSLRPSWFLHFLVGINWSRHPRQKSFFGHKAFFTCMLLLTLKCGWKWERLLWFHAAHVM